MSDEHLDEFIADAKAFAEKWKDEMSGIYDKDLTPEQHRKIRELDEFILSQRQSP